MIKLIVNLSTNVVETQYQSKTFDTWVQDRVYSSASIQEDINTYTIMSNSVIKAKYPIGSTIVEYL